MKNSNNEVDFTCLSDIPEDRKQALKPIPEKDKQKLIQTLVSQAIKNATIPGDYHGACDVRLLNIDLTYQRMPHDLNKLVKNFTFRKLAPLLVSYRNGKLYIIDGFHRLYVCILNGIFLIPITILMDLTQKEEAEIFATQDNGTTSLSNESKYKANLVWGDPCDTTIKEVCDKYGLNPLDPDRACKPALSGCRPIFHADGKEGLDWVFNILYKSKWSTLPYGCSQKILAALHTAYRYVKVQNKLDEASEHLIQTLSKNSIQTVEFYGKGVTMSSDKRAMMRGAILRIANGECTTETINLYTRSTEI